MNDNPWNDIELGTAKRIDADLDFFWAKDWTGKYLVLIEVDLNHELDFAVLSLEGFNIDHDKTNIPSRIILMLTDSRKWEIFKQICLDLLAISRTVTCKKCTASSIFERLHEWQHFLKSASTPKLPTNIQMGLYSELHFLLYYLAPIVGLEKAILAWVGPDRDKQDFRLNSINIEVKAYLDKKRGKVSISSLEQLNPQNGDLFLSAFGLKIEDTGETLASLISKVESHIKFEPANVVEQFYNKLSSNGYILGIEYTNLKKFFVFEKNTYYVSEDFPKINMLVKKDAIISMTYEIDLSLCHPFLTLDDTLEKRINLYEEQTC